MNFFSFILVAVLAIVPAATFAQSASDAVETTANGTINWTIGEVYAKGIGAPPAFSANRAQARAMAERAAFVVAIRNLLETVKGVRIDSETVVENYLVKSDVVRTRVDGIVRGARIVNTQYLSDGSVEVLVGMAMKGAFLNAFIPDNFGKTSAVPIPQMPPVLPQKPSDVKPGRSAGRGEPGKREVFTPVRPAPAAPDTRTEPARQSGQTEATLALKGGIATGLVIDGRGLGLRPALLPRIIDQEGHEVYVGQVVTRTNAVEQGVAGYAKDVNAAANNFRVTDNPAVIRALSASGAAKTDLVIGQADAQALRQLSSKADFLQYCRVIIVY